ncbi:MAG: 16S rRNA (cytidine(1402)-2'-O)-methyltransferase [Bacilli bacterium]
MYNQSSFTGSKKATLYIVSTPIGNLDDMTYRAVKCLQSVSLIAAEDTRQTMKLVTHFELSAKLISYHDHNRFEGCEPILQQLAAGEDVALVSDAGTPCISDPGDELVRRVIEAGYCVVAVPGASAVLTALVPSGISAERFYFYGFLGRKEKQQKEELETLKSLDATLLFYESPHRVKETLKRMAEVLGEERKACVARELTKKFETYLRGTLRECYDFVTDNPLKGECVIVVEGADEQALQQEQADQFMHLTVAEHVEQRIQEGVDAKEAIKEVAKVRGLPKRDVYRAFHT